MVVIAELLFGTLVGGKGKENIVNHIKIHYICAGRGCKDD
jgi:hypothetical protein